MLLAVWVWGWGAQRAPISSTHQNFVLVILPLGRGKKKKHRVTPKTGGSRGTQGVWGGLCGCREVWGSVLASLGVEELRVGQWGWGYIAMGGGGKVHFGVLGCLQGVLRGPKVSLGILGDL